MFGALIGDIIGSCYEFENHRSIYFEIFSNKSRFTDDTVCTAAIADTLQKFDNLSHDNISNNLRVWCCSYLQRGFGSMFYQWVVNGVNIPYNSFGNGALMRVSPVAKYAIKMNYSLKDAKELAKKVTEVTHNHPQALLAVEIYTEILYNLLVEKRTASVAKQYIKDTLLKYNYATPKTIDEYRVTLEFDVTCETSLLVAFAAIDLSDSFEDVMRYCVSVGGDSDTYAAIAGPIAESIWGCDDFIVLIDNYFKEYDKPILNTIKNLY